MMHCFFRRHLVGAVLAAALGLAGMARAHLVPDMTVEAEFAPEGSYTLRISVDPRSFLASDPASMPPVPASWYQEQTPGQIAATHEKAQQYLSHALGLLFNGQKTDLPACEFQAMDGADNSPLKADSQEVHLLATARGRVPEGATSFQIDYAKDATTSLILLQTLAGKTELRPQVRFAGETSLPFQLNVVATASPAPAAPPVATPPPPLGEVFLIVVLSVVCILGIVGWRLLGYYRHYHRGHRKPGAEKK